MEGEILRQHPLRGESCHMKVKPKPPSIQELESKRHRQPKLASDLSEQRRVLRPAGGVDNTWWCRPQLPDGEYSGCGHLLLKVLCLNREHPLARAHQTSLQSTFLCLGKNWKIGWGTKILFYLSLSDLPSY